METGLTLFEVECMTAEGLGWRFAHILVYTISVADRRCVRYRDKFKSAKNAPIWLKLDQRHAQSCRNAN